MRVGYPFHSFLGKYLSDYLQFKQALGYTNYASDSSLASVARSLDYFLAFYGVSSLKEANEDVLTRWVYAIRSHSSTTRNKYLLFARKFFDYLIRLGLITQNPTQKMSCLKIKQYRPYIFTLMELHKILSAARNLSSKTPLLPLTLETFFFLIYSCALRVGEALKLRICDVDFDEKVLLLWNTKFHKERVVPFSPAAEKKLRAYLAKRAAQFPPASTQAPFFFHRGKALYYLFVHAYFHRFLETSGIPHRVRGGARIHDLRHTAATHRLYQWYQEGHDILNKLPLLSTFMGHETIESTQVYLTITQGLLRDGNHRFQAAFEAVVKKKRSRTRRSV